MAFTVDVDIDKSFEAETSAENVFAVVSNVPFSVSHFPKVDDLVDEGDGVYRWEMQKIGLNQYFLQTVYACKYVSDADKLTVKWTPVKGVGNAVVSGKWSIKAAGDKKCKVTLSTKATLELPFPSLAKLLLAGFIRGEFESMVATYLENLQATFKKGKLPPAKKAAAKKPAAKKK